jgi:hypothetical protein
MVNLLHQMMIQIVHQVNQVELGMDLLHHQMEVPKMEPMMAQRLIILVELIVKEMGAQVMIAEAIIMNRVHQQVVAVILLSKVVELTNKEQEVKVAQTQVITPIVL